LLKIAIFTEAGSGYGYGHLSRCIALKQGFEEFGICVDMYVRGDLANRDGIIKTEWLDSYALLFTNFDVIVIDSYHADKRVYEEAAKAARLGVWFDDTDRINYPGGYVIRGKDSVVLRKAFWNPEKNKKTTPNKIFISFGGTDCERYIKELISVLRAKKPELSYVIASKLPSCILGKDDIMLENVDSDLLALYMSECSYAVSAGGQTMLELSALGIPTVAVIIADNQRDSVIERARNGNILGGVNVKDSDWTQKVVDLLGENKKISPIVVQTKAIVNDILGKLQGI